MLIHNLPHCTICIVDAVPLSSGSVRPLWLLSQALLVTSYLTPLSCLYGRALTSRIRADWCWKCTGTLPNANTQRTIYALASHLHGGLYWENWRLLVSAFHGSDWGKAEAEHVISCIMEPAWVFHWLHSDLRPGIPAHFSLNGFVF